MNVKNTLKLNFYNERFNNCNLVYFMDDLDFCAFGVIHKEIDYEDYVKKNIEEIFNINHEHIIFTRLCFYKFLNLQYTPNDILNNNYSFYFELNQLTCISTSEDDNHLSVNTSFKFDADEFINLIKLYQFKNI